MFVRKGLRNGNVCSGSKSILPRIGSTSKMIILNPSFPCLAPFLRGPFTLTGFILRTTLIIHNIDSRAFYLEARNHLYNPKIRSNQRYVFLPESFILIIRSPTVEVFLQKYADVSQYCVPTGRPMRESNR